MSEQDTAPTTGDENAEASDAGAGLARSEPATPGNAPREDDRNEEIDESPAPDPTQRDTNAADDPQAD
jgi:hypothetical protein